MPATAQDSDKRVGARMRIPRRSRPLGATRLLAGAHLYGLRQREWGSREACVDRKLQIVRVAVHRDDLVLLERQEGE